MGQVRMMFDAAQQGDQAAEATLLEIAAVGDKEAEHVLFEEVRKVQLKAKFSFQEAFDRVIAAHPVLHLAYLNSNGVKW